MKRTSCLADKPSPSPSSSHTWKRKTKLKSYHLELSSKIQLKFTRLSKADVEFPAPLPRNLTEYCKHTERNSLNRIWEIFPKTSTISFQAKAIWKLRWISQDSPLPCSFHPRLLKLKHTCFKGERKGNLEPLIFQGVKVRGWGVVYWNNRAHINLCQRT